MIKKIRALIKTPLFWIFVFALILRIFKLGEYPVGFHVDEAKVAWNSYSILKTAMDDRGNIFSLYYNSFGDYRPTGIFYATIPFLILFGKSIFAVRFSSAFFGALTIFPIYLLTNILFKEKLIKNTKLNIGHISAFLIAISPWHIEVSRATSEVVISTFFAIYALYFLIMLIEKKSKKFMYLSMAFILVSYLLYHAIRFLAPPIFIITLIYYFGKIKRYKDFKLILIPVIFVLILTLFFSSTPEGKKRFDQVSIFKDIDTNYEIGRLKKENGTNNSLATKIFDNKYQVYFRHFLMQYGDYFSEDFLIGYSARPYRYTTPGTGLLMYTEILFFIIGLIEIVNNRAKYLPLFLLLIGPLPAALTTEDAPNLHRAFLMLPFLVIIETIGVYAILQYLGKGIKNPTKILVGVILLNFSMFLYMYFVHADFHKPLITNYVLDGASFRDVGATELAKKLDSAQLNYEKIVVSNVPDDPYPWYAFFTNKNPKEFNPYAIKRNEGPWSYKNIVFSQERCPSDNSLKNYPEKRILIIDHGDCAYESKIKDGLPVKVVDKIKRSNGDDVYVFLERI